MAARSWDKLPQEVLRRTFEYLHWNLAKKGRFSRHDIKTRTAKWYTAFTACQLVCKGWSKEAQRIVYTQVYLGNNIARFAQTVTLDAPYLATFVENIHFTTRILTANDAASSLERLLLHCQKISAITSETLRECEQLIWPTLLLDDIQLLNLVRALPEKADKIDSYLHSLIQLKFRNSLSYVDIKSLPPRNQDKYGAHLDQMLMDKLGQFSSADQLKISHCSPPTHTYFDGIVDACAASIQHLEIGTLDLKTWNSQLEDDITPNTSIRRLRIKKLLLGDHSLLYLIRKFTNLIQVNVECSDYTIDLEEDGKDKVLWGDLKQILSLRIDGSFHVEFGNSDKKATTVKCLHFLDDLEGKFFSLKITLWDADSNQKPEPPLGITIERTIYGNTVGCHVVLPRKEVKNLNELMIKWKSIVDPFRIALNGIETIDKVYNCLVKQPAKQQQLLPFFDMNNSDDIKHLLTKFGAIRNWYMWSNAVYHGSCSMKNSILCQPPPENIPARRPNLQIFSLNMEASIISTEVFPELSNRAPKTHYLTLEGNSYIMDDPYTLNISMPETTVAVLRLNLAPLLKGIPDLKDNDHLIENSLPDNHFLLNSIAPDGQYTLKIETESKTRIYKRQGSSSHVVDLKPEEVTTGTQDDYVIWIKLKELGSFAIYRDDTFVEVPICEKFQ